jgi:transposase
MLNQANFENIYLACGSTDLRKSIDGLAVLVSHAFGLDPFSKSLFIFCNRERNKLKILFWDHNGFWLYYRRLERGRFTWPAHGGEDTRAIGRRELGWLLDGLKLEQKRAHAAVTARTLV